MLMILAAAVATLGAQENAFLGKACSAPSMNEATLEHLRSIALDGFATAEQAYEMNSGEILGYTRIHVDFHPCPVPGGSVRKYNGEWRYALERYFLGKHLEKSFQIVLSISPTNLNARPILLTLKRDSDNKGEGWATTNDNGNMPLPYFRIDRGSKVTLTPEVSSKRDYNSQIASGVIDIITKASMAIAPKVPLITSENKQRFNDAATFIDTSINGLLHVEIGEKARVEAVLNPGQEGQLLAVYAIGLPSANDVYATDKHPDVPIGVWAVVAEPVRASMLGAPTSGGHLVASKLSPADILGFSVDANKTVRETLSGASDVVAARDELVKATAKTELGGKAYRLCRLIDTVGEKLELTSIDRGAIAWAYIQDLALTDDNQKLATDGCSRIGNFPK